MFRIAKTFEFQSAHQLADLPEGHKCARLHGHSYASEIVLASQMLQPPGFVLDFADLAPLEAWLKETFDHRLLNDVLGADGPAPTSENLARYIYDWAADNLPLPQGAYIERVRISETARTWAEYTPRQPPPEDLAHQQAEPQAQHPSRPAA